MAVTATGPYVAGVGMTPCRVMLVGEGPGEDESYNFEAFGKRVPTPFLGKSGQEQDRFLMMNSMHRHRIYMTNLIKRHIPSNADPTADDIRANEGELVNEIHRVQPEFILAVGAFATRWFLGNVDLESTFGLPHYAHPSCPAWDILVASPATIVIPCYHPAYGLYSPDAKPTVFYGYQQAGKIVRGEIPRTPIADSHPAAEYMDAGPRELAEALCAKATVAADTESPLEDDTDDFAEGHADYWGFSVSSEPGWGVVCRRDHPRFSDSVRMMNQWLHAGVPGQRLILHNALGIDLSVFRHMGVEVPYSFDIYDTMIAAFFTRIEPQGLKPLSKRWNGMAMRKYREVIGDAAIAKQYEYLFDVSMDAELKRKVESILIAKNDGTSRLYTPQPPATRAASILADWNEDQSTSLAKRWRGVDRSLRDMVARRHGAMPTGNLNDVPVAEAIAYAGRDPDATLRLYHRLHPVIAALKLESRLDIDQQLVTVFEEMQDTGFLASRPYYESLSSEMWDRMMEIGQQISHRYNDDRPFNPGSAPQVVAMCERFGIRGTKRSKKTKRMSTSKKSMEFLRTQHEAMDLVFKWREHQKVKTSFADPILDRIPDEARVAPVRCTLRTTRVSSDRLSASNPNLTAMPVASDLGRRVRGGFIADEDCLLGTADLSQIEMRVMADLSRDARLCQFFIDDRDIHHETAAQIFHLSAGDFLGNSKYKGGSIDKMKHRNPTKRAGFGVITGIQGLGLLDQLRQMGCEGWSVEEFDDYSDCVSEWCPGGIIHSWFGVFPGVRGYLSKCRSECYQRGYVRERGGFIRYLPGIWDDSNRGDNPTKAEAGRQAHSHIIQGTAQWMLRVAMTWLKPHIEELRRESGLPLRWVLQIHDEILFHFHQDLEEPLKALVLEALSQHVPKLRVPVKASWASGPTWASLEK